jgi:phage-related baseplate assembly protein
MTTTIDLSRVPPPAAIEALSYETMLDDAVAEFLTRWNAARVIYPNLPEFNTETLDSEPAVILIQAAQYLRLLDRQRVNDAVSAVLAPLARGADLDNVAARLGVQRLVVIPADGPTPAVMESDERLLTRYLLAFDRPSAGSAGGYLFDAYSALPIIHDAAVIGHAVHGRRGDTDVVVIGPGGRLLTANELTTVRTAVLHPNRKPEAVSVSVLNATRRVWNASLVLEISLGPDPSIVRNEADARIRAMALTRMRIGAELPAEAVFGAAYGPNVIRVRATAAVPELAPQPYGVPVLGALTLTTEVRS